MKSIIYLAFLFLYLNTFSQKLDLKWGEEFKITKGLHTKIICLDSSSLYFLTENYIGISLLKTDKNFNKVYNNILLKEFRKIKFANLFLINNELIIIGTDYLKKEKSLEVYAAKINKETGEFSTNFQLLNTFSKDNENDRFYLKVAPLKNKTSFLLVSNLTNVDNSSLTFGIYNKDFKLVPNSFGYFYYNPNKFIIDEINYSNNKKYVIIGRNFELETKKDSKKQYYDYKNYSLIFFDEKGRKEKIVNVDSNKIILSAKLLELKNDELIVAGFYGNDKVNKKLSGAFMSKFDLKTGTRKFINFNDIEYKEQSSEISEISEEDERKKEYKKNAKKQEPVTTEIDDIIPNNYFIKYIDYNENDKRLILAAEVSNYEVYLSSSISKQLDWNHMNEKFINQSMVVAKFEENGKLSWVNFIPKDQKEETTDVDFNRGLGFRQGREFNSFFGIEHNRPYYSSFISTSYNNKFVLIYNDHKKNIGNLNMTDKIKRISDFNGSSNIYSLSIDIKTGKIERTLISENSENNLLMPNHGVVNGNDIVFPYWNEHKLANTDMKFAKIVISN